MHSDDHAAHARGMKVHLRLVRVGARVLRVVSLRPSCAARFSTNLFHHTWHILSDRAGAFVLARLFWGLAFQRARRTIVVIAAEHLVTTPFDADAPDPIVVVNTDLGRVDAQDLRAVRKRLREPSDKTVRFHTFGLPHADSWEREPNDGRERVERVGGFVCYAASAAALRSSARTVHGMRSSASMGYHYLAPSGRCAHADGEVQVFSDFRDRVSAARVARRVVLGDASLRTMTEREAIYSETASRTAALHRARHLA